MRNCISIFLVWILLLHPAIGYTQGNPTQEDSIHTNLLKSLRLENDKTKRMNLHGKLGKHFFNLDLSQATLHYQHALDLAKELNKPSDILYYYERLGTVASLSGNYQKAIRILEEQLPQVIEHKDSLVIMYNYDLGLAYFHLHAYEQASYHFDRVAHLSDSLNNPRMSMNVTGLIAKVYTEQGLYSKALDQKKIALKKALDYGKKEHNLAFIYKDLGMLYLHLDLLDSAEFYVGKSLEISEVYNEYYFIAGEAYLVQNLILQEKGEFPQAIEVAKKAFNLAQKVQSEILKWQSCQNLAETYIKFADYDMGLIYAFQAQIHSKALNNKEKQIQSYTILQKLFEKKSEFEQAYKYQSLAYQTDLELRNSRKNLEKEKQNYLLMSKERKVQEVLDSQEYKVLKISKVYGLTLLILLLTILVVLATFIKKPLFNRIIVNENILLFERDLKVRFIKKTSLMMSIITSIVMLYHFIWKDFPGLANASFSLLLIGGLGLYATEKTLKHVLWVFMFAGYVIILISPMTVGPIYAGFIALITVYLTLNYLSDQPVEYITNLSMLFISFVVYLFLLQKYTGSLSMEAIGLEAITGISCTIAVVAIRYYSSTHSQSIRIELIKSQLFLEEICDVIPFSILSVDRNANVTYANKVMLQQLETTKEELLGTRIKDLPNRQGKPDPWEVENKVLYNGITTFIPAFHIQDSQGKDQYLDIIKKPIYDENQKTTGILMVGVDTTDKRKTQKSLEEREMILNSIINTLPDPVFVMGSDSNWEIHNKAFPTYMERVFGKRRSEELTWAKKSAALFNEDWQHKIPDLQIKEPYLELIQLNAQDGSKIDMEIYQSPLMDKEDKKIGTLFLGRDQTEKLAQQKLITQQVQDLNEKNSELKKYIDSNSHLEQFAFLASHDLRTPIRTIVSFTQLLKRRTEKVLSEQEHEYMNFIIRASKNMMTLVDDILSYSRVNTNKVKLSQVEIPSLIHETLEVLQVQIQDKKADIQIGELPEILVADSIKMRQLFQNLLSNALKFTRPHVQPVINIYAEKRKNHWKFFVKDNGLGIKKEYQKKIFLLFNRLHSDVEIEGFGIGLASCKKIVEQHEGKIGIDSKLDQGSCFYFSIPLALVPDMAEAVQKKAEVIET